MDKGIDKLDAKRKTALFGGTFDPVHSAHVNIARRLAATSLVEQTVFVPAGTPPHKRESRTDRLPLSAGRHRLAMLELAVAAEPAMFVSDFELQRKDVSYTIYTAEHFARLLGGRLYLVLGTDSLRDLQLWHESRRLVSDFKFIIYPRPHCLAPPAAELRECFGPEGAAKLQNAILDAEEMDISSTMIRERLRTGKSVTGLLPDRVLKYIMANRLYEQAENH